MSRLSAREEAFLAEMGIAPLWTLRCAPGGETLAQEEAAPGQAAQSGERADGAPARPNAPATHPAAPVPGQPASRDAAQAPAVAEAPGPHDDADAETADEAIARMDWEQLRAAVASCTRCAACKDGRKSVFGAGPRQARWLVAAGASTAADEAAGQPLAGDSGKLLDNMLAAVGLSREQDAYVTNLVKCRPTSAKGGDRAPTAEEATACRPYLERELALTNAGTVLTLGQIAADGLLGKPLSEPLAASRGAVHEFNGVPLVATLHPGELLRRGADKAFAWADLCRARAARARPG
jgi:uracil-DNA glycosylase